jgi:lambda family phage portal protein
MNRLDRVIAAVAPGWARQRLRDRMALRAYEAASDVRGRDNRRAPASSGTTEIAQARAIISYRAREAIRNDGFARRIVDIWVGNAVGAGITTAWQRGTEHAETWRAWANSTACDWDGTKNLGAIEALATRAMVSDGEALIRLRAVPVSDRNPIGLALQVLEADHLAADKIGEFEGRRIVQGIELDEGGRVVAYWLYPHHPGDSFPLAGLPGLQGRTAVRVERRFVLHIFRALRPGQLRDVSWLAPGLGTLSDLGEYESALLMKAKIEACLAAIVSDDSDETLTGETPGSALTDGAGNPVESFEPGMILHRRGAGEVAVVNPSGGGSHSAFARRALERAAVGCGLTYDQVSGDLTGANYSSLRAGKIEFRRLLDQVQWTVLVPQLCTPIAEAFHLWGAANGRWRVDRMPAVRHTPPPPDMVDPGRDTAALVAQVRAGFVSQRRAVESFGDDFEEVVAEIAESNEAIDAIGHTLDTDPRRTAKAGSAHDARQVAAVEIAATGASTNTAPDAEDDSDPPADAEADETEGQGEA